MTVNNLLAEFGRKAGLGALSLDDKGVCRLSFDGTLVVDLEHDSSAGVLHLYAVVGSIPADGKESLFARLLEANLFGAQTSGAALAIDRQRNEILLCRSIMPDALDAMAFEKILESFVNALEQQREQLTTAVPGTPVENGTGMPSGMEHMLRA